MAKTNTAREVGQEGSLREGLEAAIRELSGVLQHLFGLPFDADGRDLVPDGTNFIDRNGGELTDRQSLLDGLDGRRGDSRISGLPQRSAGNHLFSSVRGSSRPPRKSYWRSF